METDEIINMVLLLLTLSKVRPFLRPGVPTKPTIYKKFRLTFYSARKRSKQQKLDSGKQICEEQTFFVSKKKKPPDLSSELEC